MEIAIILIVLNLCHFLADYTHLSNSWMLNAKRLGSPLFPIFCHALVHGLLMALCLEVFFSVTIDGYSPFEFRATTTDYLFLLQVSSHFFIDVWKGKMNKWFPLLQSPSNKWHWVVFGADQFFHQLIIIIMAICATS